MMINSPLPPGSTIGILGGGQLGRMLAIAAAELGYHTHIYCPEADAPAYEVSKNKTVAAYDNKVALKAFAQSVDVVTYEFENIPVSCVEELAKSVPVWPDAATLASCQHRVLEKQAINKMGIATAPFHAITSLESLNEAIVKTGLPVVLKTARMGYDGKGQNMLNEGCDVAAKWNALNTNEAILEGFVDFTMEISVIAARDAKGNIACYPPVQNIHKHHILSETIVPAPISDALSKQAESIAKKIAEGLNLVGILAIEMFVTRKGDILVNELAPRPHNSGHWTIDACATSQFEQTVRAVCGLPLGSTTRLCDATMLNLIGDDANDWKKYLAMPNAKLHLYGKKESRAGRKMGHVTFLGEKS